MNNQLSEFKKFTEDLPILEQVMPAFFIGHGSPMNGIEINEFSMKWQEIGQSLPAKPKAVLVISAHWLTNGTAVTAMNHPKTIHDFRGFPDKLFQVSYPAPGNPNLAHEISQMIEHTHVFEDHDWGLDHGTWSVVKWMFPEAEIPVLQLSIDYGKSANWHFELAKELVQLRKKGILIIGSGNMIHNLYMVDWKMIHGGGFDWAQELNEKLKKNILAYNTQPLINYEQLGSEAKLAIPTPDHYYPMIYSLGLRMKDESIQIFNDKLVGGSLNMTSFMLGLN